MNLSEAIERRVSVRSYDERPVDTQHLQRLIALSQTADHLTGAYPRVELVSGAERTQRIISHVIGSYGLVLTPPHLLIGVLPTESELARLDLGYVLEQVVLEATRLRLGTCWITGTYDAQSAGDAVGLAQEEVAAAVIALGIPSGRGWGRIHTGAIRRLAGGHKRKPLKEIVFAGRWGKPWQPEGADATLVSMLEYARLAPSAVNRQPWRFIVRPGDVALAMVHPKPIDAGIVMAHVALAAEALGHNGRWHVRWRDTEMAQTCGLPHDVTFVGRFC